MEHKFKVGDRVRRIKPTMYPECYGLVGREYTVIEVNKYGIAVVEGQGYADPDSFELVEEEHKVDYNDGKWHGWDGGECPVHGESIVEFSNVYGLQDSRQAQCIDWDYPILFRVVVPYVEPKEPREWDVVVNDHGILTITFMPDTHRKAGREVIRVREVLE